jgi:hypothetical protein
MTRAALSAIEQLTPNESRSQRSESARRRYTFHPSRSRPIRALRNIPLPSKDPYLAEHVVLELRYWLERAGH